MANTHCTADTRTQVSTDTLSLSLAVRYGANHEEEFKFDDGNLVCGCCIWVDGYTSLRGGSQSAHFPNARCSVRPSILMEAGSTHEVSKPETLNLNNVVSSIGGHF